MRLPLQQAAQRAESVAGHASPRDQLPQRLVQLARRETGLPAELVGEERAALLEQREQQPCPIPQRFAPAPGGIEQPRKVLASDDRDGRRPPRRSAPRRVVRAGQTAPGDLPGEAELVEQRAVVPGDARGQHVALPGSGGGLEALKLADDLR